MSERRINRLVQHLTFIHKTNWVDATLSEYNHCDRTKGWLYSALVMIHKELHETIRMERKERK